MDYDQDLETNKQTRKTFIYLLLYPGDEVKKIINSTAIIVIFRQNICLNINAFKCIIALLSFSCSARLM